MASPFPSIPSSKDTSTTTSINHPPTRSTTSLSSTSSSSSSSSITSPTLDSSAEPPLTPPPTAYSSLFSPTRISPRRKPSASSIVPREHPHLELQACDESFDADDARTMSPRRSSEDIEKMSREARAELQQHAKSLQSSLLEIFNRIEAVREEHDKLDSNNKFLQKYIGDLMSTSKITGSGGSSAGGGGSSGRKK